MLHKRAVNELIDPLEAQCDHDCLPVGPHQCPIGFRLFTISDIRGAVDFRATGRIWESFRLLSAPMLNDFFVLKAEQVKGDHRSSVTSDTFVSGMEQHQISVGKRTIDCYVGRRRARYFRSKRLHSSKTIGKSRVMLYERLAKIPIDGRHIFLSKDIDHCLASVDAQGVGGRHGSRLGRTNSTFDKGAIATASRIAA
jgi:hypothetical protein